MSRSASIFIVNLYATDGLVSSYDMHQNAAGDTIFHLSFEFCILYVYTGSGLLGLLKIGQGESIQ